MNLMFTKPTYPNTRHNFFLKNFGENYNRIVGSLVPLLPYMTVNVIKTLSLVNLSPVVTINIKSFKEIGS